MISINLQCSEDFKPQAKYVFKTIFFVLGIDYTEIKNSEIESLQSKVLIHYGSQPIEVRDNVFLIHIKEVSSDERNVSSDLTELTSSGYSHDLPKRMAYLFKGDLPALKSPLYHTQKDNRVLISTSKNAVHCAIDLIASAFYFLSFKNEIKSEERDNLNRFKKSYSQLGEEIYDSPVLDHYYTLFSAFLKMGLNEDTKIKSLWPANHSFALSLSHDVDSLATWSFSKIKGTLLETGKSNSFKGMIKKLFEIMGSVSSKDNWSGNFDFIINLENQARGRSTFFIASNHRTRIDPNYSLKWKRIKKGIKTIKEHNSSIGLHGTILSSENEDFLKGEKEQLELNSGVKIIGNRQHYLRFDINKTFDIIEKAGFLYDSTLGFDNELGYRCGTTLPFQPYSIKQKRAYPFWEIPLILMDTVFLLDKNLDLSGERAWSLIEEYLENAYSSGYCLTLNWHNTIISSANYLEYTALYKKILNWAHQRNAWICSLDDLYNWWVKR
jgi:hypothetical protein